MKKFNFAANCILIVFLFASFFSLIACNNNTSSAGGNKNDDPVVVSYTVTFETEIGDTPEPVQITEGEVISNEMLPELEDENWDFLGWFDGEIQVVPGEYKVVKNVTLTAHWKEKNILSYKSIFGTVPEADKDFALGMELTDEMLSPVDDGIHVFLYWYDQSTEERVYSGDIVNRKLVLVAKWKECSVTIKAKFDEEAKTISVYAGDMIPSSEFEYDSPEGYSFEGFEFDGKNYGKKPEFIPEDDCEFTGVWTKIPYVLQFDKNNSNATGTQPEITFYIDSLISFKNADCKLKLTGYTFAGWNTEADGSGTLYNDDNPDFYPLAKDVTLYAQWIPNVYKVYFYANDGTKENYTQDFTYDVEQKFNPNHFVREGYRFAGWNTKSDGTGESYKDETSYKTGTRSIDLYAQWVPADSFAISYNNLMDVDNSKNPKSYRTSEGFTLKDLTLTGYDFKGWFDAADENGNGTGNQVSEAGPGEKSGDLNLYAKWERKVITITFYANYDGNTQEPYTQQFYYGETVNLKPNEFVRKFYKFNKWRTSTSNTYNFYEDEAEISKTYDFNLYADWTRDDKFYITYMNTKGVVNRYNYEIFNSLNGMNLNDLSLTGYVFEGWYLDCDENGNGTGTQVTRLEPGVYDSDVTLYAKWSPRTDIEYEVYIFKMYKDGTYSNYTSEKLYLEGTTGELTDFTPPEYEGYEVEPYENVVVKGDGSTYLYLYYALRNITLSFDLDGGTGTEEITGRYNTSVKKPENPVKEGFKFKGWEPEWPSTSSTYELKENMSFKALWDYSPVFEFNIESIDKEITVEKSVQDNQIIFTVPDDFIVTGWWVDGVKQRTTANTFVLNTESLVKGVYSVYVQATKEEKSYSMQINVVVK